MTFSPYDSSDPYGTFEDIHLESDYEDKTGLDPSYNGSWLDSDNSDEGYNFNEEDESDIENESYYSDSPDEKDMSDNRYDYGF